MRRGVRAPILPHGEGFLIGEEMKITSDNGKTFTVELDDAEHSVLSRIADAMNTVAEGRPPASLFEDFVMAAPMEMMRSEYDVADYILADLPPVLEPAMRRAFIQAGVWGEEAFARRPV